MTRLQSLTAGVRMPHGAAHRRSVASIHARTSSLSSRGSRPAASIGGPITTRIDAGLLHPAASRPVSSRRCARPERSCSPRCDASRAPLTPYLRVSPTATRVPSGKIRIHSPSREPLLALLDDLRHCGRARLAIDRDRLEAVHRPADQRDPHQLALQHPGLRRKDARLRDRFPCRRVLPHRDVRAGRNVLATFDRVASDRRASRAATDACAPSCARRHRACDSAASSTRTTATA